MIMEYIPSILNPIARITPLKREFTVPMSFIRSRTGKLTTILVYACLYDSAIPVAQPYIYTTRRRLSEHFLMEPDSVKNFIRTLAKHGYVVVENNIKTTNSLVRNNNQKWNATVYRMACQIKPVFDTTSLIQYIKFNAHDINKMDKMSLVVLAYLKEISYLIGSTDIKIRPSDLAKGLNRDRRRMTRTLYNMDKQGIIEWQRRPYTSESLIRLK